MSQRFSKTITRSLVNSVARVDTIEDWSPRIVVQEILDKEWLRSGNASFEASIWTEDGSLADELRKMRARSTSWMAGEMLLSGCSAGDDDWDDFDEDC